MKILLTGAGGFIGARFCAMLAREAKDELVALVRASADIDSGHRQILVPAFSDEAVAQVIRREKPDAIVHLAAAGVDPRDRDVTRLIDINVRLPAAIVRAAAEAGTAAVVMAGSSAEYAPPGAFTTIGEESTLESHKLYGASKAAGGILALALGESTSMRVVVLRLFNVFGAGEAAYRLFPSLVSAVRSERPVALSAGTQTRDFVEVDDACLAIYSTLVGLCRGRVASGHYNLCSGIGTTVANFARTVVSAAGGSDRLLELGLLPMRPDDVEWVVGNPDRLRDAIGWRAVSLHIGIEHALAAVEHTRGEEAVGMKTRSNSGSNSPSIATAQASTSS